MKYIDAEKLKKTVEQAKQRALKGAEVDKDLYCDGRADAFGQVLLEINSLQQEQTDAYDAAMLEVKKYVDKLYDDASIGLNEYDSGLYNGIIETCMKLRGFIKARTSKEQSEVDYNNFEKLFDDFCERNKGHHISSHDACMWFWELGLNARKGDTK